MQQTAYTESDYEQALKQEDRARAQLHNNLLFFGLAAIAIGGTILFAIFSNPLIFWAIFGFALIAGWHLGLPYYRYRQARYFSRRMEAWRFATHESTPPVTGIPVTEPPPGYCANDVHPTFDPDPRSYYKQGYQGVPPQMV